MSYYSIRDSFGKEVGRASGHLEPEDALEAHALRVGVPVQLLVSTGYAAKHVSEGPVDTRAPTLGSSFQAGKDFLVARLFCGAVSQDEFIKCFEKHVREDEARKHCGIPPGVQAAGEGSAAHPAWAGLKAGLFFYRLNDAGEVRIIKSRDGRVPDPYTNPAEWAATFSASEWSEVVRSVSENAMTTNASTTTEREPVEPVAPERTAFVALGPRTQQLVDSQVGKPSLVSYLAAIAECNKLERELAAKTAEAATAEATIRETYRAWLGRDYEHLELPAAVGKMRRDLEATITRLSDRLRRLQ